MTELILLWRAIQEAKDSRPPYSYELRVRIERALFVTAARVSTRRLGHELVGFSQEARRRAEEVIPLNTREQAAKSVIFRAFELKSVLVALASGSSYLEGELYSDVQASRMDLGTVFIRRLEAYARLVTDLMYG